MQHQDTAIQQLVAVPEQPAAARCIAARNQPEPETGHGEASDREQRQASQQDGTAQHMRAHLWGDAVIADDTATAQEVGHLTRAGTSEVLAWSASLAEHICLVPEAVAASGLHHSDRVLEPRTSASLCHVCGFCCATSVNATSQFSACADLSRLMLRNSCAQTSAKPEHLLRRLTDVLHAVADHIAASRMLPCQSRACRPVRTLAVESRHILR